MGNSGNSEVELGFSRQMKGGKSLSATLTPKNKDLEVELVDSSFEDGATWTATANMALDDAANMKDSAKLSLKRSWAWLVQVYRQACSQSPRRRCIVVDCASASGGKTVTYVLMPSWYCSHVCFFTLLRLRRPEL